MFIISKEYIVSQRLKHAKVQFSIIRLHSTYVVMLTSFSSLPLFIFNPKKTVETWYCIISNLVKCLNLENLLSYHQVHINVGEIRKTTRVRIKYGLIVYKGVHLFICVYCTCMHAPSYRGCLRSIIVQLHIYIKRRLKRKAYWKSVFLQKSISRAYCSFHSQRHSRN